MLANRLPERRTLPKTLFGLLFGVLGILLILYLDERLRGHSGLPEFSGDMSYGLLFAAGLLTGFHCVGMCGALVISYTAKGAASGRLPAGAHLLYGLGKTLSYTLIGAGFGLLGSIIAFTPYLRGVVGIAAGVLLVMFGLGMLRVWSGLQGFHFRTPGFLLRFIGRESKRTGNPFIIGLLNGLMIICGPLQAMYIMAAGTGSSVEGAKLLFVFGLGTLPVMLGFGLLTTLISARLTPQLVRASGAIVVVLGAIMINRGLAMTGSGHDFHSLTIRAAAHLERYPQILRTVPKWFGLGDAEFSGETTQERPPLGAVQEIRMAVTENGFEPNRFTVRRGTPVKWLITAEGEVNPCASMIVIPRLGLEVEIKTGVQVVEFTPSEEGIIPWSCWMGMLSGTILVVDDAAR